MVPVLVSMKGETSLTVARVSGARSATGATSTSVNGGPSRKKASKTSNTASRGPSWASVKADCAADTTRPTSMSARGDDPVRVGLQLGVGQSVLGRRQRRFGSLQGGLRRPQILLRLIKGLPARWPRVQERLVPLEGQRLLPDDRLRRLQPGAGDLHVGPLFACRRARARTSPACTCEPTSTQRSITLPLTRKESSVWIRAFTSPVISARG